MPNLHAVLTGDLVASRSSGSTPVAAAMDTLARAATEFCKDHDLPGPRFTRFRGDGWQILLTRPGLALDAALFLLARLRAADLDIETRIAIGVGTVDTPGTRDLSDADGPAFHVAGDLLDQIGRRRRLTIGGAGIGPWQIAALDLVDHLSLAWSAPQAEAVALALAPAGPTHDVIATGLGITRQAVQSRLSGAGFGYLDSSLAAFRAHDFGAGGGP